ncbi:MAG: hypothetical protein AABW63_03445 [Nanoarchaeota archaeon]
MKLKPETKLGKWSVRLNIFFLIIVTASLVFVLILKILNFDDRWWDITVPIAVLIEMTALYTGIRAMRKNKDKSVLVYLTIITGICTILFALLHSLFIND